MKESGYYPPGAEFDPNAPYNQKDPEERTYNKHVVVQLEKKNVDITVWEGYDEDWEDAYKQCYHGFTFLLDLLKSYIEKEMEKPSDGNKKKSKKYYQELIKECEGWQQTYFEAL